jgi:hypothetical protein
LGNDSVLALSTTAVGVGTNTPSNFLQVTDPNSSVGGAQLTLEGRATGYGAGVVFSSRVDNASGALVPMAKITGDGEDSWTSTAATQDAGMRFSTATNGSLTEKMRISSAGNVGIGTTAPASKLVVRDTASFTGGTNFSVPHFLVSGNSNYNAGNVTRLAFANNGDGNQAYLDCIAIDGGGNTSDLAIRTRGGGGVAERARILSSGGITFNGDTAEANALDDYEEGTWTPVLRGASTAGTYEIDSVFANYTKIGRQVSANMILNLTGSITGGGTGYAQITGLPFTKGANQQIAATAKFGAVDFAATTRYVTAEFNSSSATSIFYFTEIYDNAAPSDLPIASFGNNSQIQVSLTYFV